MAEGLLVGAGLGVAAYGAFAAASWLRYGYVCPPADPAAEDVLLDFFMPHYEVVERHSIEVAAPAEITFEAACENRLEDSCVVRALFKMRELALGSRPEDFNRPSGMIAAMRTLGWGVLAVVPGREIVMGAFTRPWVPRPVFRALPPEEFSSYIEPGQVKIAWTLRADSRGPYRSTFRTETRVVTTDAAARAHFRRYWSMISPGVWLIRQVMLGPVRREAERRAALMLERSPA